MDSTAVACQAPSALEAAPLQLAIETTMVGQIDPGRFLDTALELAALELRANPIPEPTPSGAIRYPVLGTPEGVNAELWVKCPSANSELGGPLLTYHVRVHTPPEYQFEGAARSGLEVQIALWTDKQGGTKYFSVITDGRVDNARSKRLGLGMEHRKLPTGAMFGYDAGKPLDWSAQNCGLDGGRPYDSDGGTVVLGGRWPRTEDLEKLKSGMLTQYKQL